MMGTLEQIIGDWLSADSKRSLCIAYDPEHAWLVAALVSKDSPDVPVGIGTGADIQRAMHMAAGIAGLIPL
jgi:hypothetical protein